MADPGGSEIHGNRRAQAAETDDQGVGAQQFLLAGDVDLGQQDLAAVAQQLGIVHDRIVPPAGKPRRWLREIPLNAGTSPAAGSRG